ncbi:ATP-binding protein [Thalassospira lucentensis]|uniref:ATP-binding protein n=1 Tax=Thalassospira lucentensis TaxID=168935 RepID=UPI00142DF4FF|nr:ATP-binding protein [Thalassospira lucentensis]NIZ01047.1 hypothetical protein [Thalassospira lucentensis]
MSDINASGQSGPDGAPALTLLPSAGRTWYQSRVFWRTSLIAFCIGMIVIGGSWASWQFVEGKQQNDIVSRQVLLGAVSRENTIRRWFEAASQILQIAAQNTSIRDFDQAPNATVQQLRSIATIAPRFSQLRILGEDGVEEIRIDRTPDGLKVAGVGSLQDKSNRYYFTETAELTSGEVYISPIDLNVERGVIEIPWRPTARLATPIRGVDGRRGYLVFNLDMAVPLADFGRDSNSTTRTELVNKDGYWLAGVEEEKLWAFMTGAPENMARDQQVLWQKVTLNAGAADVFWHEGRFYSARLITPIALSGLPYESIAQSSYGKLYIIASAPAYNTLLAPRPFDVAILLIGAVLMAILSCIIGIFNLRRKQAQASQERIAAHLVSVRRMASLGRIVAGVTHEMRTPIGNSVTVTSTLSAFLDDLLAKIDGQKIDPKSLRDDVSYLQNGVRIVQKNLDRTVTLVGHFRQTAADQSNHNLREFDLSSLLIDLVATLRDQLRKDGIQIIFDGPKTAPIKHYSDAIDQVVLSLINNAERHAFADQSNGEITVRLVDADRDFYQIDVQDNGCGIDPKLHERVFEPFWTANAANPGSGLGMAIVESVVESVLGGDVHMRSNIGQGTTFSITIPKTVQERADGGKSAFNVSDKSD